jgi:HTH-type transcriptional regulator/antitoxin HigA
MNYQIKSEEEYHQVMERVEAYLQKATNHGGFRALTPAERDDLNHLSKLAESWEDQVPLLPIRQPQTLIGMIELKMYERKLKQKDLAQLLGISQTRLSEVMQGKRKINLDLAQRLYKHLQIDPVFILETA